MLHASAGPGISLMYFANQRDHTQARFNFNRLERKLFVMKHAMRTMISSQIICSEKGARPSRSHPSASRRRNSASHLPPFGGCSRLIVNDLGLAAGSFLDSIEMGSRAQK